MELNRSCVFMHNHYHPLTYPQFDTCLPPWHKSVAQWLVMHKAASKVVCWKEISYKTQIYISYLFVQLFPGHKEEFVWGGLHMPSPLSSDICFTKTHRLLWHLLGVFFCQRNWYKMNRGKLLPEKCVKILNPLVLIDGKKKPLSEPQRL